MSYRKYFSLILALFIVPSLFAVSRNTAQGDSKKQSKNTASHSANADRGEIVFEQNCSRCHNAPQGFPPEISGTVVRHMRVRASLSKKDAEELLRFLNPQ